MDNAWRSSQNSYARRLKVGACAVKGKRIISTSWNGTPSGFDNNCEDEVDGQLVTKSIVLHAEENAILKAAADGESTRGATLFITHTPCMQCAKLIYGAEFKSVIYHSEYRDLSGVEFLKSAGVEVYKYSDLIAPRKLSQKEEEDLLTQEDLLSKIDSILSKEPPKSDVIYIPEVNKEKIDLQNDFKKVLDKTLSLGESIANDEDLLSQFSASLDNVADPIMVDSINDNIMSIISSRDAIQNESVWEESEPEVVESDLKVEILNQFWDFVKEDYPNGELDIIYKKLYGYTYSQTLELMNEIKSGKKYVNVDSDLFLRNDTEQYLKSLTHNSWELADFEDYVGSLVFNKYLYRQVSDVSLYQGKNYFDFSLKIGDTIVEMQYTFVPGKTRLIESAKLDMLYGTTGHTITLPDFCCKNWITDMIYSSIRYLVDGGYFISVVNKPYEVENE